MTQSFNYLITFLTILLLMVSFQTTYAATADDFVTTWKTDNAGTSGDTSITIPTTGAGYSYQVDWNNDGDFLDTDETTLNTGDVTHDFGVAGTYTIRITGDFPRIYFNNGGDKLKILSLDQWGTGSWASMGAAFGGAANLTVPATDVPDLSLVTDMSSMFNNTNLANPDTSSWDVSSVTNMGDMFYGANAANPDVSSWDVSSVTDMNDMFADAPLANPDVSSWDVSSVEDMSYLFANADSSNPDVSSWDTSSATNMENMFEGNAIANPDVSSWDTSSVTSMAYMFNNAVSANPDLSNFDFSAINYHLSSFLNNSAMSTFNYNAALINFAAGSRFSGVTKQWNAVSINYCGSGAIAAIATIESDTWVITDGGEDCTPDAAPDLVAVTDLGSSSTDDLTSDTTPNIDVVCFEADDAVEVYTDNPSASTSIKSHTCVGIGTETVTVATLAEGAHNITYTESGSSASASLAVTIDATAPSAPTIDNTLHNATVITGTGENDSVITLDIGTCTNAPVTVSSEAWSCTVASADEPGFDSLITATATDTAGNTNTGSFTTAPYKPSSGNSTSSRINNLLLMKKKDKAQELIEEYPKATEDISEKIQTNPENLSPLVYIKTSKSLYRRGSNGDIVTHIQEYLNALLNLEHPLITDGIFGPKTDNATRVFQKEHNLDPDGIIGELTSAKLLELLE